MALLQHFLFGKQRGLQPAFSSVPPPHVPENIETDGIKKFPLGCKISPSRAVTRGWHSSPDPAITLPPKEHKAGKKPQTQKNPPQTHTQKFPGPSKRGSLDFLCPVFEEKAIPSHQSSATRGQGGIAPGHEPKGVLADIVQSCLLRENYATVIRNKW